MTYRTWRIHLKGLSGEEKATLLKLSFLCRALYNEALREYIKERDGNQYLQPAAALAPRLFNKLGFKYNLIVQRARNACWQGRTNIKENKPLAIQCYSTQRDGHLIFPATKQTPELHFPVPPELADKEIVLSQIKLLPGSEDYWELQIGYKVEAAQAGPCQHYAAIDLGVENFATIVCDNGSTLIVDGRRLKGILWYGHKRQKQGDTAARSRLYNQTNDYVQKSAAIVKGFCMENEVGTVIIGTGVLRKSSRRLKSSKLWPDFPFSRFASKLKTMLELQGITAIFHEELFTSKASFIDGDFMPTQIIGHKAFSGKRIKRGLYQSKNGDLLNADVNAAFNLLAKCFPAQVTHLRADPKTIQQPRRVDPLKL